MKLALETGRAEFHAGRISAAESLAKTTLENAVAYLLDQQILVEEDKKLKLGDPATAATCPRRTRSRTPSARTCTGPEPRSAAPRSTRGTPPSAPGRRVRRRHGG